MSDQYVVAVEGISALRTLETLPDEIKTAAARAVNKTARDARSKGAKRMREEVNFPAGYLTGSNGRLEIGKAATPDNLETEIRGRFRPTSLARFVVGSPTPGKAGVRVAVEPGFARLMKRAFVMRLPQGNTLTETKFNLGLAIRLKPGETVENKKKMIKISRGLYLLYGPSVDQVWKSVANDMSPEFAADLEREFLRLIDLGDLVP